MKQIISTVASRAEPALVSLSASGERLELTGAVAANWVYKSAGLLTELGVGPELSLGIVCPPPAHLHWRALAALLAAWSLGAPVSVLTVDSPEPAEPWVALRPETPATAGGAPEAAGGTLEAAGGTSAPVDDTDAEEVLVYAIGALALSARAESGCIDYNSAVRAYPDVVDLPRQDSAVFVDASGVSASVSLDVPSTSGRVLLAGLPSAVDFSSALGALQSGVLVLTDIPDPSHRAQRVSGEGVLHGTIGAWTK